MADGYKFLQTLMDVTIPSMSANQVLNINSQGYAGGTNYMTAGTVTTTNAQPYAVEVVSVEIISPTDVNGNYEDLTEVWFTVDGQSTQNVVNVSGNGWLNMFPLHQRVYGGRDRAVVLGEPFWKVCMSGGGNMPLRNSTIKYVQSLALNVHSVSGFTGAGNGGARIIVKGYRYTPADLAFLAPKFQPAVSMSTEGQITQALPGLSLTFPVPDLSTVAGFAALPGGVGQKAVKINPYWHFATNAQTTQQISPFVLSADSNLGGASGNVANPYQDLGFAFAGTNKAAVIRGYGVQVLSRPSFLQRIGWRINGSDWPTNNGGPGTGQYASDTVNDFVFGDPGYYVGSSTPNTQLGLYEPIPRVQGESLLLAGVNAAPWVASASGNPIPQGAVAFALNGVLIEQ